MGGNLIRDRSFAFAVDILRLCGELTRRREFVVSKQLLRSGTSVGANVEEALGGQSSRDFRSKMMIARKEARESHYWLRLLREGGILDGARTEPLLQEASALIRILTSIILTVEQKQRDGY